MAKRGSISAGSFNCALLPICSMRIASIATHPQVDVQTIERLHLSLGQIERSTIQVGNQSGVCVCLGNDCDSLLRGPAQENLAWVCSSFSACHHVAAHGKRQTFSMRSSSFDNR